MSLDFANVETRQAPSSVIPKGTVVRCKVDFKRPEDIAKQSSESKCITIGNSGSQYLNAKVTITGTIDGKWINKTFFQLIGLRSGDDSLNKNRLKAMQEGWKANPNNNKSDEDQLFDYCNKWGNDGKSLLKQIIQSVNDLASNDKSPEAFAKMAVPGYEWFEGKEFVAILGVDGIDKDGNPIKDKQTGENVEPTNRISYLILKDNKQNAESRNKLLGKSTSGVSSGFGLGNKTSVGCGFNTTSNVSNQSPAINWGSTTNKKEDLADDIPF